MFVLTIAEQIQERFMFGGDNVEHRAERSVLLEDDARASVQKNLRQ